MNGIDYRAGLLRRRLLKRYKHLSKWARRADTEAWRLYDRDIPEVPLRIDIYKDLICAAYYPYEQSDNVFPCEYIQIISDTTSISPQNIYCKIHTRKHHKKGEGAQYEKSYTQERSVVIRENGLLFRVNLNKYLDTGLFLDARLVRKTAAQNAGGRRVLNLFAYTGTFSVYAAHAGAAHTCSVDISNTYLGAAAENFALNTLSVSWNAPLDRNGNILVRADCRRFIEDARQLGQKWDIIILDPPVFSNSKKMDGVFYLKRDYQDMLNRCAALLAEGGSMFFSAKGASIDRL
jgi:23S rRNA G2069 N7-methylase RlmK/C1962 C5-methylase RlmI